MPEPALLAPPWLTSPGTPAEAPSGPRRVLRAGTVRTVLARDLDEAEEVSRRIAEAELAALLDQARVEGHADGVAATLAAGAAAQLRGSAALEGLCAHVVAQQDREVDATAATVLELGLAVAQWVLRRELTSDGTALLSRLEEGLTALLPSPTTRISVSHDDHGLVAEWAESRGRVGTEVVADARLLPGDAVVVTDAGRAELTVAAALRTAGETLGLPEMRTTA